MSVSSTGSRGSGSAAGPTCPTNPPHAAPNASRPTYPRRIARALVAHRRTQAMRAWHLLLLTVAICLLLLFREIPVNVQTHSKGTAPAGGRINLEAEEPAAPRPFVAAENIAAPVAATAPPIIMHVQPKAEPLHVPAKEPTPEALTGTTPGVNTSLPGMPKVITVASTAANPAPFIALGIVSNCMWPPPPQIEQQANRRKWIRETFLTYPNVGKSMPAKFIVGMLQSNLKKLPPELEAQVRGEARAHDDMLLLETVPERKSPCLKTMAWYRYAVHAFPRATFIAKTDDDAYVHTVKLEVNMRPFVGQQWVYVGSTLWGSYITKTFEPCARRLGPMMAHGGMAEENCRPRGAIGPYPYAVGMLQVLSHQLASWMVVQEPYTTFERRATAATRPPMMDQGEDMVIGMFIYQHPEPVMPLHWGWDKLHDLCFLCTRKDQIWRPITYQSVVAHHVANEIIINDVHRNITARCDDKCVHKLLPFEVTGLEDLCSRGQIKKVYSKCAAVKKS